MKPLTLATLLLSCALLSQDSAPASRPADALSLASIRGQVVDDVTGEPVPEFDLVLTRDTKTVLFAAHWKRRFGPPDWKNGVFDFAEVRPGRWLLLARAPGYAGGWSAPLIVLPRDRLRGVEIRLLRGARVTGRVIDAGGTPIADAVVLLDHPLDLRGSICTPPRWRNAVEVRTDREGRYVFPNVLGATYVLTVRHPDFGPEDTAEFVAPSSGELSRPAVVLQRGGRIRGRVLLPNGEPDAKAIVVANPRVGAHGAVTAQIVKTDADGRYDISGLEVGEYRVFASQRDGKPDLTLLSESRPTPPIVTISAGDVKELDL